MEKPKGEQKKIKRPSREELERTLKNIVGATEEQELREFGLTPELETEIKSRISSNPKAEETLNRKDQVIEAARQWVKSRPRYRIRYLDRKITIENIDGAELDKEFLDFLVSQAAEARGFRGAKFFEEEKIKRIKTLISKRNIVVAVEDEEENTAEFYFQQHPPFKLLRAREVDEEDKTENKYNF